MDHAFLSEIRLFAGDEAPDKKWAACDGRKLDVNQHAALFSLIEYTYGGSGNAFALPDLRGRVPVGSNEWTPVGQILFSEPAGSTEPVYTVALSYYICIDGLYLAS